MPGTGDDGEEHEQHQLCGKDVPALEETCDRTGATRRRRTGLLPLPASRLLGRAVILSHQTQGFEAERVAHDMSQQAATVANGSEVEVFGIPGGAVVAMVLKVDIAIGRHARSDPSRNTQIAEPIVVAGIRGKELVREIVNQRLATALSCEQEREANHQIDPDGEVSVAPDGDRYRDEGIWQARIAEHGGRTALEQSAVRRQRFSSDVAAKHRRRGIFCGRAAHGIQALPQ